MKSLSGNNVKSTALPVTNWNELPWGRLEKYVRRLQQRIYRAESLGQKRKVRNLQRMLMKSKAALLLSIRRATQLNKGKRTAGVDGYKALTPPERVKLYNKMRNYHLSLHHPKPTRRTYIPKKNKKLRPLGIPTMIDRVFQNIVKMALEPQWEQRFEGISYGFRPKRGVHDAATDIYLKTSGSKTKKMWVFEGDFAGCFDNLDHNYILEQIQNFPQKEVIAKWLKAGFVDNNVFNETSKGTPQGGIVSPLLANIALHGMEKELGIKYKLEKNSNYPTGGWVINDRLKHSPRISIVRYADDFVIFCETKEKAMSLYDELQPYLAKRGLKLAKDKTRVTKLTNGFDFLGFTFRKFYKKNGKFSMIVKPSKETTKRARTKIKEVFVNNTGSNVSKLISELLPVIRGYANHWKRVVSKEIFSFMDNYIFKLTKNFLTQLHPKKSWRYWIVKKYMKPDIMGQSKNKWLVTEDKYQMIQMKWTSIIRHEKIRGNNSPYDRTLRNYFEDRDIKQFNNENVDSRQKMAKLQKFKCPLCGNSIVDYSEGLETHHMAPKCQGGNDGYKNLKLVHISCHIKHHIDFPAKGPVPTAKQLAQARKLRNRQRLGMIMAKKDPDFNNLIATLY